MPEIKVAIFLELPKRKKIRLEGYDYSQNNVYYITICTNNREHLFGEIVGAHLCVRPNDPNKIIEKWLFELETKYENVRIIKFIIMPDHIHFILFNPGIYDEITSAHTGAPLQEIIEICNLCF